MVRFLALECPTSDNNPVLHNTAAEDFFRIFFKLIVPNENVSQTRAGQVRRLIFSDTIKIQYGVNYTQLFE